jgi:hypothetical protein
LCVGWERYDCPPLRVKWEHVYDRPSKHCKQGVSHLGTLAGYSQRVPKQRYSPPTPEVAARVERVVALFRQQQEVEAEYRRALAEVTRADGDAVPIAYVAGQLGVERKTVYRHLGRRMT